MLATGLTQPWVRRPRNASLAAADFGAIAPAQQRIEGKSKLIRPIYALLIRPIYTLRLYDLQAREVLFGIDLLR